MADNSFMKQLVMMMALLLSQAAVSSVYISCGAGVRQQGWTDAGWLNDDGDVFSYTECRFQQDPPAGQGWLKALPDIRWQQGLSTGLSRSRGYLQSQQSEIFWPVLRQQELLLGLTAGHDTAQQQHRINTLLQTGPSGTLLNRGRRVVLEQQEYYAGISLDTRLSDTPITRTSLLYRYRQHPVQVLRDEDTALLSRATIGIWELQLEREALRMGWQWHGSVALFQGQIGDLQYQPLNTLNTRSYAGIKAHIGLHWRYRLHRNLYPWLNLSSAAEYWYAGERGTATAALNSFTLFSHQISTGITLRF